MLKPSQLMAGAAVLAAVTFTALPASADNFRLTNVSPHFTVYGQGANVSFTWYAPVPTTVEISRYSGGYSSNPSQTVVYSGPPPSSLGLTGGGRPSGRYTIKNISGPGNYQFTVDMSGNSNLKTW